MSTSANRNMNLLYPPFRERLEMGLRLAHYQGLKAYPFECWRPGERQSYLYAKGRSTPGMKVTWVKPGYSWHHYGVACDVVFDGSPDPGVQWSWEGDYADNHKDDYGQLGAILKSVGLEWLGDRNIERAHFQMTFGMNVSDAKRIADAKGILGLWNVFDQLLNKKGEV